MLLPRVLTAVLFVPVVLAVVWFGGLPFLVFASAITLLGLWEYALIADEGGFPNQLGMSLAGGALMLLSLYLDGAPLGPIAKAPGPIFVLLFWMFFVFLREFVRRDK
ncbi:MAG: phosphatidate cytidylyltransferase, partial [Elusimicrobia bacterium]|nr:phosphatidate cytidylyltransferase [Elusimicrobiota bacterium]